MYSELPLYLDYYWKNGKPVGAGFGSINDNQAFKVIRDPYGKRYSVEKYALGKFVEIVYDSSLFDFRHLKSEETSAWQRENLEELPELTRALIRSMDERIILREESYFKDGICHSCKIFSPHGVFVGTQNILRTSSGDLFNGVILHDCLNRPVVIKKYSIDESNSFTELLGEQWDHKSVPN